LIRDRRNVCRRDTRSGRCATARRGAQRHDSQSKHFMKLPRPSGIQAQPLRDGNSECVRPADLERSFTVRLLDYLRCHGGRRNGTPPRSARPSRFQRDIVKSRRRLRRIQLSSRRSPVQDLGTDVRRPCGGLPRVWRELLRAESGPSWRRLLTACCLAMCSSALNSRHRAISIPMNGQSCAG
jgi:hypothetical protein